MIIENYDDVFIEDAEIITISGNIEQKHRIDEVELAEHFGLITGMYKGTMCVKDDLYNDWMPIEEWEYTKPQLIKFQTRNQKINQCG